MLIQINITIPPTGSAGPFDLFSDANAYSSPFQTQVPATALENGYVVTLPIGATIIRVCSVGTCENCIDLPTNCPTTTTTSTSSTTTTTSTSSTTTTTTTAPPPYEFNFELYTQTPGYIGTVNLVINVDGSPVTNTTITSGADFASGTINVLEGQVVTATITNSNVGTWDLRNIVSKDGSAYQPEDACDDCDQLITPLFSSYTMEPFNTLFQFGGNIIVPTTTTTTSTSTSTSTSTTSTTSTTTTIACCLNGPVAVIVPLTTTTTTSSGGVLEPAQISSQGANSSGAACGLNINTNIWARVEITGVISTGDTLWNNPTGTSPYIGNDNFRRLKLTESISAQSEKGVYLPEGDNMIQTPFSICS
jgi:hypothetical protein